MSGFLKKNYFIQNTNIIFFLTCLYILTQDQYNQKKSPDTSVNRVAQGYFSPQWTQLLNSFDISNYDFHNAADYEQYRESYIKYIAQHPYNQAPLIPHKGLKSIPKRDRPDLPMEQNFLMTMDPFLGYVPSDRGLSVFLENWETQHVQKSDHPRMNSTRLNGFEKGPSNTAGRTRTVMFDPNDPSNRKVWAGGNCRRALV